MLSANRTSKHGVALTRRLRSRLRRCLKNKGLVLTAKPEELLGCTWQQALEHLHDNPRGLKLGDGVEIDHIKPFQAFQHLDTAIEQRLVNNWRNLQLLTAEENIRKGATHDQNAWAVSDAGVKLLAFERELTGKTVHKDTIVMSIDSQYGDGEGGSIQDMRNAADR
jgi:hypothetical protein